MPRRKAAIKREVLPDPLYSSERLAKFINVVMRRGKKSVAEQIVYNALKEVMKRLKKSHGTVKKGESDEESDGTTTTGAGKLKFTANRENLDALEKALHNIRPT